MSKRLDTDAEIDALFQLPLADFTSARNALATRLRREGHDPEAERVKALQKPPISAWAVNQLHWRHRDEMDALLDAGERFRKAQATQLAGRKADLRQVLNERRDALSALMKRASGILRDAGHASTPETSRRVATTLEALATWGRTPEAPHAGRLSDDVEAPGFEALAALVPRAGSGKQAAEPSRLLHFRREERRRDSKEKKAEEDAAAREARAREAVREAERTLRDARRDAERAQAALKKAAARAKSAEAERAELEARYETQRAEAEAAAKEARRLAEQAEAAAEAVTDAERAVERATQEAGDRR